MQEYRKAVKAVSEPSRAQELKRELEAASLEDLQEELRRSKNQGKRRRLRKRIAELQGA